MECTGCGHTHKLTQLEDLFCCPHCNLNLLDYPSKVGRFTVYKEKLVPVFPWSDPVKVIEKVSKNEPSRVNRRRTKRKSFDD